MSKIFLVGDESQIDIFIKKYILDLNFLNYQIENYKENVSIELARAIIHNLSYKTSDKKLIIIRSEISLGAQNSLLKLIEEADENIHFIFCASKEYDLISTIRSRLVTHNLLTKSHTNIDLEELLGVLSEIDNQNKVWYNIDRIGKLLKDENLDQLQLALRHIMLNSLEKNLQIYYDACKKLLKLMSLYENNNVNKNIIIESIFLNSNVVH